jgi:hypothetical protein
MGLKIHSVVNGKKPQDEYTWLHTDVAVNTKGYAVVDRTFDSTGKVSNEFRHIFVFPDLEIGKDDWIRLYTGTGKYSKVKADTGGYIHNLYWEADSCVWNNNGGDRASLIKYSPINAVTVPAVG